MTALPAAIRMSYCLQTTGELWPATTEYLAPADCAPLSQQQMELYFLAPGPAPTPTLSPAPHKRERWRERLRVNCQNCSPKCKRKRGESKIVEILTSHHPAAEKAANFWNKNSTKTKENSGKAENWKSGHGNRKSQETRSSHTFYRFFQAKSSALCVSSQSRCFFLSFLYQADYWDFACFCVEILEKSETEITKRKDKESVGKCYEIVTVCVETKSGKCWKFITKLELH